MNTFICEIEVIWFHWKCGPPTQPKMKKTDEACGHTIFLDLGLRWRLIIIFLFLRNTNYRLLLIRLLVSNRPDEFRSSECLSNQLAGNPHLKGRNGRPHTICLRGNSVIIYNKISFFFFSNWNISAQCLSTFCVWHTFDLFTLLPPIPFADSFGGMLIHRKVVWWLPRGQTLSLLYVWSESEEPRWWLLCHLPSQYLLWWYLNRIIIMSS